MWELANNKEQKLNLCKIGWWGGGGGGHEQWQGETTCWALPLP